MAPRDATLAVLVLGSALMACKAAGKAETAPAASAAVTAEAPRPSNQVEFKRKVPPPGTKSKFSRTTTIKFSMGGKVFREVNVLGSTTEVKHSDDFRITKALLKVDEMYSTSQEGTGAEKKTVSPLAGSTFTVTRYDDGTLGAQDANGNKVAADQLKLIKEEFGATFEKSKDTTFLPDRPLKLDEKLMPASDTMLAMMGIKDDDSATVEGTELILKSATPEKATFDTSMTLTQKLPDSLRLRVKLKGTIELRPDGAWLVGIDLSGPITILDSKGAEKGTGELSVRATQTIL